LVSYITSHDTHLSLCYVKNLGIPNSWLYALVVIVHKEAEIC
jgi:hypothetical protein